MAKIAPRWRFVLLLAGLIFVWGASQLVHSCRRAQVFAEADPLPVYPHEAVLDSAATVVGSPDSSAAKPRKKAKKAQQKMGKHGPVARDFLNDVIDEGGQR